MVIDGRHYMTTKAAAQALATTAMRVLMLMRKKELVGVQLEGEWLVAADSVDHCLARGTEVNGAVGCATFCASTGACGCRTP